MCVRGCANRRVANASIGYEKAVQSLRETPGAKSSQPIGASSYSPDGSKIAYAGTGGTGNWDIYTIPASGGTPTKLTNDGLEGHDTPSYSSDGSKIAYTAWDGVTMRSTLCPPEGVQPPR